MRTIVDHKVNGLNEAIEITALDQPGPGGANHRYAINLLSNLPVEIRFQNGPINRVDGMLDFNGITNEALLAVVIDRMRGFQYQRAEDGSYRQVPGPFACRENAIALTHLEEALMWLQSRTRRRIQTGKEGSYRE